MSSRWTYAKSRDESRGGGWAFSDLPTQDRLAICYQTSEAALKNIIVCMKQVLDPEIPLSLFRIDPEAQDSHPAEGDPAGPQPL